MARSDSGGTQRTSTLAPPLRAYESARDEDAVGPPARTPTEPRTPRRRIPLRTARDFRPPAFPRSGGGRAARGPEPRLETPFAPVLGPGVPLGRARTGRPRREEVAYPRPLLVRLG